MGLRGVDCIRMACQHVPNEVMTDKNKYVRSIVTSAKELNDDPKFNAVCDVVMSFTEFASRPSGIELCSDYQSHLELLSLLLLHLQ